MKNHLSELIALHGSFSVPVHFLFASAGILLMFAHRNASRFKTRLKPPIIDVTDVTL